MSLEKTLLNRNSNQHIVDEEKQESSLASDLQKNNSIQSHQSISNQLLNDKLNQESSQVRQESLGFSQRYSQQSYQYKNRKISFLIFLLKCLVVLIILVAINIVPSIKNYTYSEYIGLTVAFLISFCCFLRFYYYNETNTSSIILLFIFSYLSQGYLYLFSHCFFIGDGSLKNLTLLFLSFYSLNFDSCNSPYFHDFLDDILIGLCQHCNFQYFQLFLHYSCICDISRISQFSSQSFILSYKIMALTKHLCHRPNNDNFYSLYLLMKPNLMKDRQKRKYRLLFSIYRICN
ncbi:hypothetical protein ABPG74_010182 [Tetrahymena malaccensis]